MDKRAEIAASFSTKDGLAAAVREFHDQGFRDLELLSPFPLPEISGLIRPPDRKVQGIVLIAAFVGGAGGYLLQFLANPIGFPLNIGSRPMNSVPAYMQVTFEMMVLLGSLVAAACVIVMGTLGRLHHPQFGIPGIEAASRDGFFLIVKGTDPLFERSRVMDLFRRCDPVTVHEVQQ